MYMCCMRLPWYADRYSVSMVGANKILITTFEHSPQLVLAMQPERESLESLDPCFRRTTADGIKAHQFFPTAWLQLHTKHTGPLPGVLCSLVQHNLTNTAYSLGMSRYFAGLKLMFIDPDALPCRNWPTNRVENCRKSYPAMGRHMQQILSSAAVYTMYYKFTDVNGRLYLPLTPIVEPACPHARGWTGDANPTRRQLEP